MSMNPVMAQTPQLPANTANVTLANAAQNTGATAQAQANAVSGQSLPAYPDLAQTMNVRQNQMANGSITGAFTAGPNNPWNSRWVFGNQVPQVDAAAQEMTPGRLEQLSKLAMATGSENAESVKSINQNMDQLASLQQELSQLQGQIEGLNLEDVPQESDLAQKPALKVMSGDEYLALQGLKDQSQGQAGAQTSGGNSFGSSKKQPQLQSVAPDMNQGSSIQKEFKLIQGGLSKTEESPRMQDLTMGVAPSQWMNSSRTDLKPVAPQITGHVVPGSMMRDRLTSESIHNISSGIQNMKLSQGGEMKIKLNPGHLGELMIKVSTDGQAVGLKVQASDPKAKKILEDSVSSLKESLAQQQLALNKVDISIAPPSQSQQPMLDSGGQNSQLGYQSDMLNQQNSRDYNQQRQSDSYSNAEQAAPVYRTANASQSSRASRVAGNGRVDLMA